MNRLRLVQRCTRVEDPGKILRGCKHAASTSLAPSDPTVGHGGCRGRPWCPLANMLIHVCRVLAGSSQAKSVNQRMLRNTLMMTFNKGSGRASCTLRLRTVVGRMCGAVRSQHLDLEQSRGVQTATLCTRNRREALASLGPGERRTACPGTHTARSSRRCPSAVWSRRVPSGKCHSFALRADGEGQTCGTTATPKEQTGCLLLLSIRGVQP